MEFPLFKLMKEIKTELGPLLKELGVRPKLEACSWGVNVEFKAADGSFSPIELQVGLSTLGDKGWRHSNLVVCNYTNVNVGSNGWKAHEAHGGRTIRPLSNDSGDAFAEIRHEISKLGIVQVGEGKPFYISDLNFIEIFQEVKYALDEGYEYVCARDENGIESFSFTDPAQREWRLAFEGEAVVIFVDGESTKSVSRYARREVAAYFKWSISEPGLVAGPRR